MQHFKIRKGKSYTVSLKWRGFQGRGATEQRLFTVLCMTVCVRACAFKPKKNLHMVGTCNNAKQTMSHCGATRAKADGRKRRRNTAEADAWLLEKSPNAPKKKKEKIHRMCSRAFQSSTTMNLTEGRTSAHSSPLSSSSLPLHLHATQHNTTQQLRMKLNS